MQWRNLHIYLIIQCLPNDAFAPAQASTGLCQHDTLAASAREFVCVRASETRSSVGKGRSL